MSDDEISIDDRHRRLNEELQTNFDRCELSTDEDGEIEDDEDVVIRDDCIDAHYSLESNLRLEIEDLRYALGVEQEKRRRCELALSEAKKRNSQLQETNKLLREQLLHVTSRARKLLQKFYDFKSHLLLTQRLPTTDA